MQYIVYSTDRASGLMVVLICLHKCGVEDCSQEPKSMHLDEVFALDLCSHTDA